jgi:hypothetical protein
MFQTEVVPPLPANPACGFSGLLAPVQYHLFLQYFPILSQYTVSDLKVKYAI